MHDLQYPQLRGSAGGVTVVFRKRCTDSLPLPLCTANLLVSSQWALYGVLVKDQYIIIPNGVGIVLAILQIALFAVFPRRAGDASPLACVCPCLRDLELGAKCSEEGSPSHTHKYAAWAKQRIGATVIPPSRSACIAFLRSSIFNSGGYYPHTTSYSGDQLAFANSGRSTTSSRFTDLTTLAGNATNTSLFDCSTGMMSSRAVSVSHPELWRDSVYALISASSNGLNASTADDSIMEGSPSRHPLIPSQPSHYVVLRRSGFDFDRIAEVEELDRLCRDGGDDELRAFYQQPIMKRTYSAPNLSPPEF